MRKSRQNKYTGLFYVLPFVIGLLVFQLYPFLASFFYSFTDLSIANDWSWVGLSNYIKSFTADRDFWNSLKVTGIYVFIAVPCKLVFALFIAMVLNMKIRGIRFFQTLYYIPSILGGSVAVSVIWRFMFSHDGLVNTLTSYLGLPALDWLGSKAKNFYAPLLCSAADAQGLVSLRVCSEQLRVQKCTVYWQLRGAQDAVLLEGQQTVDAQPLSVTPAGTVDCASWLTEKAQRQTVYLCYWMETEAGCTPVSVLLFCKPKHFRFAAPELSLSVQEQEDAFILTLAAEHMAKYVWLDSPDFDFILSDNCLDIVPGRPAVLILKKSDISRAVQADELKHLDTLCAYDIR